MASKKTKAKKAATPRKKTSAKKTPRSVEGKAPVTGEATNGAAAAPAPPPDKEQLAAEWAAQARMRIMAVEDSRRLTAFAAERKLTRDASGNETAKRALILAEWLQQASQTLARDDAHGEPASRHYKELEKTIDRMWNARVPRNAEHMLVSAVGDLMDLSLSEGVGQALQTLKGGQPDFSRINPELVRAAAEAWSQGKRRGPVRVLAKATGVAIPTDDVIDKALDKRK